MALHFSVKKTLYNDMLDAVNENKHLTVCVCVFIISYLKLTRKCQQNQVQHLRLTAHDFRHTS